MTALLQPYVTIATLFILMQYLVIYNGTTLLTSSYTHYSGVQGQQNWTYLYYTPKDGYNQLTYNATTSKWISVNT